MRAKFVNEESGYYPPGAENDPNAPWNETEDKYEGIVEIGEFGEIELIKRRITGPDDWEDDTATLDPEDTDNFLAAKLEMESENIPEGGFDIKNVQDTEQVIIISTNYGDVTTSFEELEDLI